MSDRLTARSTFTSTVISNPDTLLLYLTPIIPNSSPVESVHYILYTNAAINTNNHLLKARQSILFPFPPNLFTQSLRIPHCFMTRLREDTKSYSLITNIAVNLCSPNCHYSSISNSPLPASLCCQFRPPWRNFHFFLLDTRYAPASCAAGLRTKLTCHYKFPSFSPKLNDHSPTHRFTRAL